jgi:hypothetical protein
MVARKEVRLMPLGECWTGPSRPAVPGRRSRNPLARPPSPAARQVSRDWFDGRSRPDRPATPRRRGMTPRGENSLERSSGLRTSRGRSSGPGKSPGRSNGRGKSHAESSAQLRIGAASAPGRTTVEGADANYQICARSFSGRTIGSPGLHPNASAKAGILDSGPMVRNSGGACVSTFTSSVVYSGRLLARQI